MRRVLRLAEFLDRALDAMPITVMLYADHRVVALFADLPPVFDQVDRLAHQLTGVDSFVREHREASKCRAHNISLLPQS